MRIRRSTPEDHAAVVDIYNRIHFDSMPLGLDEYRQYLTSAPAGTTLESWVGENDGRVVGGLDISELWYAKSSGAFRIYVDVDPERTGRGIGSALYRHLTERAAELRIERMYVEVREDDEKSLRFASSRGFQPTGRVERHSRLVVAEANLDGFEGLEEGLARDGVTIRTLAEIGQDETCLRALHHMSEVSSQSMPRSEAIEERPFEYWLNNTMRWPGNSPEWCWIAVESRRPVGLARLRRQGNAAFNAYTCVDREYWGRGIARALKRRTILWARESGIEHLFAGNDADNRRMLDINLRLGYRLLPGDVEMVREVVA